MKQGEVYIESKVKHRPETVFQENNIITTLKHNSGNTLGNGQLAESAMNFESRKLVDVNLKTFCSKLLPFLTKVAYQSLVDN